MGVNAPILSNTSLKLLLFAAPFFYVLSVTSKWAKSPVCVSMCLYVLACVTALGDR